METEFAGSQLPRGRALRTGIGVALRATLAALLTVALPAVVVLPSQPASAAVTCADSAPTETQALKLAHDCGRNVVVQSLLGESSTVSANPAGDMVLESFAVPQRVQQPDHSWRNVDLRLSRGADGLL